MTQYARYVVQGKVEAYFQLGWMMAANPLMHDGDWRVWLMIWPCECKLEVPQ